MQRRSVRREWWDPQHQQQLCAFEVMVSKHSAFSLLGGGGVWSSTHPIRECKLEATTRGALFCVGEIVAPLCARDKQMGISLPCFFEYKESCSWTKQVVRAYMPPETFASATQKVSALELRLLQAFF